MTTGSFASWTGNIADLGPLYPFVGSEWFFVVVAFIVWMLWHIIQIRMELRQYKEHSEAHGDRDSLTQIMAREEVIVKKQARREMA